MFRRFVLIALIALPCFGQSLDSLTKIHAQFSPTPILLSYELVDQYPERQLWNTQFKQRYGDRWRILVDVRGGTPANVYGRGIPMIAGLGNELPFTELPDEEQFVNQEVVEFINSNARLFRVQPEELVLEQTLHFDQRWHLTFSRSYKDVPVEGSYFLVSINHGNLVRFGTSLWGPITTSSTPTITEQNAIQILYTYLANIDSSTYSIEYPAKLVFQAEAKNGRNSIDYSGSVGDGYNYKLLWKLYIISENEGEWTVSIDAQSGEILNFVSASANVVPI